MVVCCFFFQAEDGIRDLVRSRGLGDVYKRQALAAALRRSFARVVAHGVAFLRFDLDHVRAVQAPVSYTHLTLPTSDLV